MNCVAQLDFKTRLEPKTENCETHGKFESKHIFSALWSRCPVCNTELEAKKKAEKETRERADKLRCWKLRVGQAGIPERFQDRSLKSFIAETEQQRTALAFADNYADRFDDVLKAGRCAVFVGKPGTGKTHLAVGIGLRIMHRDSRSVLFTTVLRAIRRIKDTWSRNNRETESQAIAAMTFPELLILDEVGVQIGSETEKLYLFDLLNERYEKRYPTIFISNLTVDEVKVYLGERIADRLKESGGEFVTFDWASHRGRV